MRWNSRLVPLQFDEEMTSCSEQIIIGSSVSGSGEIDVKGEVHVTILTRYDVLSLLFDFLVFTLILGRELIMLYSRKHFSFNLRQELWNYHNKSQL